MGQRRLWTQQEDVVLQQLYEVRNIRKWSSIARFMEEDYHIPGRSAKQCRERWYQHLNPLVVRDKEWTAEQQRQLFALRRSLGTKWTEIAKSLPGRTDNCIKNHFYSALRRSVRIMNRFFGLHKKAYKRLSPVLLSKILTVAGNRFEDYKLPEITEYQEQLSEEIIQGLVHILEDSSQEVKVRVAEKVTELSRSYKRKKPRKKKSPEKDEQPGWLMAKQRKTTPSPKMLSQKFQGLKDQHDKCNEDFLAAFERSSILIGDSLKGPVMPHGDSIFESLRLTTDVDERDFGSIGQINQERCSWSVLLE